MWARILEVTMTPLLFRPYTPASGTRTFMRAGTIATLALVLAACASSARPANDTPEVQQVLVSQGSAASGSVVITPESYVGSYQVEAVRDDLWDVLPEAFTAVGLPAPLLDAGTWTAAIRDHTVRRRLGDERLSRMFECGAGPQGAYADARPLQMDLTVRLHAHDGATRVATEISAWSYDPTGRTDRTVCTSRGTLERRIADALRQQVTGS